MEDQLSAADIKHLEFIQGIIGRLANNSFLMKGWALTISGAFFGFSVRDVDWRIAAVGLVPLLSFWGLDAYFLSREKMFRSLYDAVRTRASVEPFSMNYRSFKAAGNSWSNCFKSGTLAWFYAPLLVVGLVVILAAVSIG